MVKAFCALIKEREVFTCYNIRSTGFTALLIKPVACLDKANEVNRRNGACKGQKFIL